MFTPSHWSVSIPEQLVFTSGHMAAHSKTFPQSVATDIHKHHDYSSSATRERCHRSPWRRVRRRKQNLCAFGKFASSYLMFSSGVLRSSICFYWLLSALEMAYRQGNPLSLCSAASCAAIDKPNEISGYSELIMVIRSLVSEVRQPGFGNEFGRSEKERGEVPVLSAVVVGKTAAVLRRR
jgi:hypothetical protein